MIQIYIITLFIDLYNDVIRLSLKLFHQFKYIVCVIYSRYIYIYMYDIYSLYI